MTYQTLNPSNIHPPKPTYSHIASLPISPTATLITIAGQVGISPTPPHEIAPTFAEQVALALNNLDACLAAVGATKADIVKVTHYVVDLNPTDRTRAELYMKYMGPLRPPSTLLGVAALAEKGMLYEIEALVVVTKKGEAE